MAQGWGSGSWFPSLYPVAHISRSFSSTEIDPDTGNEILVAATPVIRYAQEIVQSGRGSSADVISGDFLNRIDERLIMSVDDSTVYQTEDQVIVNPQIDQGEYVPGTGVAYWVDGLPNDQRGGPWPHLFDGFGGVVNLRRVT